MTDERTRHELSLIELETLARAHGYEFSRERLAAVLPEVRRLRELVGRLQGLARDEESPALWSDPR